MNNQAASKFIPPLKSAMDSKGLELMRQRVNSLLNARVFTGSGRNYVNYSDGNVVYEVKTGSTELMFPFKIYGINNLSATDAQRLPFSDAGLSIDDFTFQIRGGIVSGRSYINAPNGGNDPQVVLPAVPTAGNFEQLFYAICTDLPPQSDNGNLPEQFFYQPFANNGVCTVLDSTQPTLLMGIPKGSPFGTAFLFSNQIALNPNPDIEAGTNIWNAGFWLELVDDPLNGFYVNLMGQMCGNIANLVGRAYNPFPSGPNIIPLGFVSINQLTAPAGPITTQVTNFVTANVVNRFPTSVQRGRWTELYAALPAGQTQLTWFPGDIVVDDTALITDPTSGFQYYKVFQNTDTQTNRYAVGQNPALPTGTWQVIGISE